MKKKVLKEVLLFLSGKAIESATPALISHYEQKREEKSFFEVNKGWIYVVILSIFVIRLDYINLFENIVSDSIINIIFGIIIFVLLYLFYKEEKEIFKKTTPFMKFLIIVLFILGFFNSIYHISYSINSLI